MDFRHDDECECIPGGAAIFAPRLVQKTVLDGTMLECFPVADVGDGPIEFFIPACENGYLYPRNHMFEVKLRVKKYNDEDALINLAAGDKVSLINFALHGLFQQLDLWLNETLISSSSDTYAYRAYIENLLCYSKAHKKTQLATELFAADTAGHMDDLTGVTNIGFNERLDSIKGSRILTLQGVLHHGFLRQDRFLLNGCSMRLKLTPHNQNFPLMAAAGTKLKLELLSARLEIAKLDLDSSILMAHAKNIEKGPALYPLRRGVIKTFSVATGSMQLVKESLFSGPRPRRIVCGFLESDSYGGTLNKCPWNFVHVNCSYMCCFIDGVRYPTRPLTPNYNTDDYAEVYNNLVKGSGLVDEDTTIDVPYKNFKDGYCLYVITLTPGEPGSAAADQVRSGNLRLEAKFRTALASTVVCLCYAEFDNLLEVTRERSIITDW